jgi:hypothetical protein
VPAYASQIYTAIAALSFKRRAGIIAAQYIRKTSSCVLGFLSLDMCIKCVASIYVYICARALNPWKIIQRKQLGHESFLRAIVCCFCALRNCVFAAVLLFGTHSSAHRLCSHTSHPVCASAGTFDGWACDSRLTHMGNKFQMRCEYGKYMEYNILLFVLDGDGFLQEIEFYMSRESIKCAV